MFKESITNNKVTNGICAYYMDNGCVTDSCRAIDAVCNGRNKSCSFYKTIEQDNNDTDRAIERCRELGLCTKCKYTNAKCLKSTERDNI